MIMDKNLFHANTTFLTTINIFSAGYASIPIPSQARSQNLREFTKKYMSHIRKIGPLPTCPKTDLKIIASNTRLCTE
jgi:hypothetical protein